MTTYTKRQKKYYEKNKKKIFKKMKKYRLENMQKFRDANKRSYEKRKLKKNTFRRKITPKKTFQKCLTNSIHICYNSIKGGENMPKDFGGNGNFSGECSTRQYQKDWEKWRGEDFKEKNTPLKNKDWERIEKLTGKTYKRRR